MMTGPGHWKIAYPVFLVLMVGVGFINYLILKKWEARERKKAEGNSSLDMELWLDSFSHLQARTKENVTSLSF
jgi:hypothetical protein